MAPALAAVVPYDVDLVADDGRRGIRWCACTGGAQERFPVGDAGVIYSPGPNVWPPLVDLKIDSETARAPRAIGVVDDDLLSGHMGVPVAVDDRRRADVLLERAPGHGLDEHRVGQVPGLPPFVERATAGQ